MPSVRHVFRDIVRCWPRIIEFCSLGFVASVVILEVIYVLCIRGLMTVCMSAKPAIASITGVLEFLLVACRCYCYQPKAMKYVDVFYYFYCTR
jgi:hypothetical protein